MKKMTLFILPPKTWLPEYFSNNKDRVRPLAYHETAVSKIRVFSPASKMDIWDICPINGFYH
jgi:hypothetical protein